MELLRDDHTLSIRRSMRGVSIAAFLICNGLGIGWFTTFAGDSAQAGVSASLDRHHHFSFLSEVISYPEDQSKSGITVLETVLVMGEIETLFRSDVQKVSSGFQWDFHWDKPWLGAGTVLTDERIFKVMLWGGLVRAEKMTLEGLEAVLCHEFGHLLGGTPRQIFPGGSTGDVEHWSSTEGQSDWWAATICLPKLYAARGLSPTEIRERTKKAGFDFVLFAHFHFEKGTPLPSLSNTATEKPAQTLTLAYPSLQCRLDTFRIGADSIPESTTLSTMVTTPVPGISPVPTDRPRCWFAD